MNAFGERQHPEKFIPATVKKILRQELITVHANPQKTKAGSRSYIHCRNIAAAVLFLMKQLKPPAEGTVRDKFNIQGEKEVDNLELVKLIHQYVQEALQAEYPLQYELVDFHSSPQAKLAQPWTQCVV
jgi:dTDP-D-glucose 4,6-dehydratase